MAAGGGGGCFSSWGPAPSSHLLSGNFAFSIATGSLPFAWAHSPALSLGFLTFAAKWPREGLNTHRSASCSLAPIPFPSPSFLPAEPIFPS